MTRSVGSGTPTRDIMVIRDSVRLTSRLSLPHGPGPFACAIFVHGLGSSKESPRNVTIAQHLLAAGIATLLFDLSPRRVRARSSRWYRRPRAGPGRGGRG